MAFIAASTGRTVKAVLFDVFGTVVDWRTGVAAAVRRFAGEHGLELEADAFADAWRARYVPGMRRVSSGQRSFVPLDVLHRENLDGVLAGLGVDPGRFGTGVLDELNRAWHFLPPWPDSVAGITALKRNYIVGPLSNGNTSLLLDMAKAGGLPWDLILGSDVTRAYKPTTEAYLRPAALLGLEPGEIMLAAAHEADLTAARTAGLAAAFISRPLENGPGVPGAGLVTQSWDLAVSSITELADELGQHRTRSRLLLRLLSGRPSGCLAQRLDGLLLGGLLPLDARPAQRLDGSLLGRALVGFSHLALVRFRLRARFDLLPGFEFTGRRADAAAVTVSCLFHDHVSFSVPVGFEVNEERRIEERDCVHDGGALAERQVGDFALAENRGQLGLP